MKFKVLVVSATLFLAGWSNGHAVPITYEGSLTSGVPVTGSVGGFGFHQEDAEAVDFWSFSTVAGHILNIAGVRLDQALDPKLNLYFGRTTADESLFRAEQSWGGLNFLVAADDEVDNPGPFEDPLLSNFTAPFTGIYTIAIGGNGSDGPGPYAYQLTFTSLPAGPVPVPEPTSMLMFLSGLACLIGVRSVGRLVS